MKILAGNWKMYKTPQESDDFCRAWIQTPYRTGPSLKIVLIPPATSLDRVGKWAQSGFFEMGAQNCGLASEGAYTGEISPKVLVEMGTRYVLVGHSERRHVFNEDSSLVARRMAAALEQSLIPILCVGEKLDEREKDLTLNVLQQQLQSALAKIKPGSELMVAYEPVWAIGTGKVANSDQIVSAHSAIRTQLKELGFQNAPILYGGSVKPENAHDMALLPFVDGFLVGGASLKVESFQQLAETLKSSVLG